MRQPKARGEAIDGNRRHAWLQRFKYYREPPGKAEVRTWLERFQTSDRDLAARILDSIEVISEKTIQKGYKKALASMQGWHGNATEREGKWVFTGFGGPSESGMAMLRVFREANSLTAQRYDPLFRNIYEIPGLRLSAADTVVLVDDFSGTGRQICQRWPTLQELIASDSRLYLVLTAATVDAIQRIRTETTLEVLTQFEIAKNENVFSTTCRRFSEAERTVLLKYCRIADNKAPKGFGDCGLLYVLNHKTPNNSIPVLHANHRRWVGLFPRNLHPDE